MFEYVVITYSDSGICKDDCFKFKSEVDDCDIDPYGDNVPFTIGSNQTIVKIEDCPVDAKDIDEI